jgi:hypothetical protein
VRRPYRRFRILGRAAGGVPGLRAGGFDEREENEMTFEEKLNIRRTAIIDAERVYGFGSPEYVKAQSAYHTAKRQGPKPQKKYDHRQRKKQTPSFVYQPSS